MNVNTKEEGDVNAEVKEGKTMVKSESKVSLGSSISKQKQVVLEFDRVLTVRRRKMVKKQSKKLGLTFQNEEFHKEDFMANHKARQIKGKPLFDQQNNPFNPDFQFRGAHPKGL